MSLAPMRMSGPLGQLQLDADKLKTKINEVIAISKKWTSKSVTDPQFQTCHKDCINYLNETSTLLKQAKELQLHNEPKLPPNFEDKKSDEIKRLEGLQERLKQLLDTIKQLLNVEEVKPEGKEESRNLKEDETEDNPKQTNGVTNNESDEESEYADLYIVMEDFAAEQDGDLSLKKNEIVDVLSKRDDGWWEAENESGQRGMVPSNFLRECTEEDEDLAFDEFNKTPDVDKEQSTDAQEVVENLFDPSSAVCEEARRASVETPPPSPTETSLPQTQPDGNVGKKLWGEVRKSLVGPTKVDVTDVLAAMGALPAGFRPSTLHNLQVDTDKYSLKMALLPQRTHSNLGFQDLFWDPATSSVSPRITRILRTCNLWKCTHIPLPGTGVEILSRHVRFALFDGAKVLSNIVTVRASAQPNRPKLWQFSSPRLKDGGLLPSLYHGNTIVRSNSLSHNIGILFELGVTYIRTQTGERGELSCGWSHLKLFDQLGTKIINRTYELPLHGGTPFEVNVEVDPSIKRRAQGSRLRMLLAANKQPKLFVQIGEPSAAERKSVVFLPTNIFLPTSYLSLFWMFRCVLVESVICDRRSVSDASIIHSPVISSFLKVVDQPDVMDAIRRNWIEKERVLNKGEKKDPAFLKSVFKSVVMETAFPLLATKTLPKERWADLQTEEARTRFIAQTSLSLKQEKGVLSYFLTANTDMRPFDISEITFDPSHETTKW